MTATSHYITHAPATVNRNADQPGQPPQFPDLTRFGNSRQGRRRRRTALDAYQVAMRGHTRRPPKSVPPIPSTQPRQHYTLEQAHIGGIRSGATRRFQARDRRQEVRGLRTQGRILRDMARIVGYHFSTVSRIIAGLILSCLPFPHPAPRGGFSPGYVGFRVVGNDQSFRLVEMDDVHRRWEALP